MDTRMNLLQIKPVTQLQPVRHCQLLLSVIALLGTLGCASTEELYAEYDSRLCEVTTRHSGDGNVIIRETSSKDIKVWEPAVYFAYKSDKIRAVDLEKLDSNVDILARYPELAVAIRGWSDSRGGDKYNLALSKRRVDAVVAYLKGRGVAASRFETLALGENLSPRQSLQEREHATNRRVELVLLGKDRRQLTIGLDVERIEQQLKRSDPSQ